MAPHFGSKGQYSSKVSTFKIYLSGLPDGLKNEDIKDLFEQYGRTVECEVFKRNFGFVHMEEEDCGRMAVKELNRKELMGQPISVSISKNNEPPNVDMTKLSVKNLPAGFHASKLRSLFQKFGLVLAAEVNGNTNIGVVSLEATGDIRTAINEMNGFDLDGNQIIVEPLKLTKAERYGQGQQPPQMEWNPKPRPARARPPPAPAAAVSRYSAQGYNLGGGYGPSAQVEEFYGHQAEEYYEDEVYYEQPQQVEYEYEYEYAPRRAYPNAVIPPPSSLRAGIDYVRRDAVFYDDPYSRQQELTPHLVARNPLPRLMPAYSQQYEYEDEYYEPPQPSYYSLSPRAVGGKGGRGKGRSPRGQRAPAPVVMPTRRKVARGEPYPAPPGPNPRSLLAPAPRGGRPRMPQTMAGFGGIRPKSRGERGGKNTLTAGKLAKLKQLMEEGVNVPDSLEGKVKLLDLVGFDPSQSQRNNSYSSGGGGIGLLAAARARAAAAAASADEPDPFAPSAVEKKLMEQQGSGSGQVHGNANIDFTEDIMLM